MKVTVFNGSPAGPNSATQAIADAFLKGAASAGVNTQTIYLRDEKIGHCRGCFACWFKTPGRCVQHDDMAALLDLYNTSDIVCFGTPVYTWNMTAYLKNFVDRLTPLKAPKIQEAHGHFDLEDAEAKTQKFVVLANCGFPGEKNFDVLRAAMACCNPSLEVYRNCGRLLKSQDPAVQEKVAEWLTAVEIAGAEMAAGQTVSPAVHEALDAPLMSIPDYVKYIQMG
ncbi:flavodoxin family protein [uncultured Pseudoramibacter sp.]|uniref:flavodoxin family protein n=1 Tax=uncultured Pseudoramibacter sp. TaxID=1623493 RepID=UPI0025ED8B73|nr:flavodoxin family protein [uncultured Pseudoramibacter sp.]